MNIPFIGGYHAHNDIWHPLIGGDSLIYKREENTEFDESVVTIVFDDYVFFKKSVGHVPFHWSGLASRFLQIFKYHNSTIITCI